MVHWLRPTRKSHRYPELSLRFRNVRAPSHATGAPNCRPPCAPEFLRPRRRSPLPMRDGHCHEYRGVIAQTRSNMSDLFSFFHIESGKTKCMQRGLTIVYHTVFFKRYDNVLIKQRRVSSWSLRVSTPGEHLPGAGPKVPLLGVEAKAVVSRLWGAPTIAVINSAKNVRGRASSGSKLLSSYAG